MRIVGVRSIAGKNTEKFTASGLAALRTLLDPKVDIVHFQHISSGWAAWISKLRRQKCILQVHGIGWGGSKWGKFGSRFLRTLERVAVRECDALTSVSKTHVTYYQKKYGVNAVYIPCGVRLREKVEPKQIISLGLFRNSYVLFVGRLSKEKGLHYLIPAFRQLKTHLKLVIAGEGSDKNYNNELFKLAFGNERIVFLGFVGGRLLEELFSNAFIYVQPSECEGLSIALLEAMSYGNSCVISDIPENLQAIGDAGFHFKSRSIDSLRESLSWLIAHPLAAGVKGLLAKQRVKTCYSWEHVTDQMEALYASVLNGVHRRPSNKVV